MMSDLTHYTDLNCAVPLCFVLDHSLISAFVVRCLDSIIPLLVIAKISRLYLVFVAERAGLSLNWSETPKTGFLVTMLI